MNRNTADRIIVTSNARMERVLDWYFDNFKWLDREKFLAPMESGVVELCEEQIEFTFESKGSWVEMAVYITVKPNLPPVVMFDYDPATTEIRNRRIAQMGSQPVVDQELLSVLLSMDDTCRKEARKYHALMLFMAYYREEVKVEQRVERRPAKHKKKKRTAQVRQPLIRRIYTVTDFDSTALVKPEQAMMKHDPGYIGALKAMSEFDQEQLLNGNWKIRRSAGHYFKRSKVGQMFRSTPTDVVKWVRAWDLAATAPGEMDELEGMPQAMRTNRRGDESAYTAGVLLGKRKNGRVFVADVINVRENGADVRQLILNTAASDNALYGNVTVRLPQDPGQAGKDQAQSFVRMLGGYTVTTSLESGDKVTRAEPFSSQWLAGNVDVKMADWNDDYFRQLENFPVGKLKDMVDASANAYLELENGKPEFGFSFG